VNAIGDAVVDDVDLVTASPQNVWIPSDDPVASACSDPPPD
jgi:hypothetical protein